MELTRDAVEFRATGAGEPMHLTKPSSRHDASRIWSRAGLAEAGTARRRRCGPS